MPDSDCVPEPEELFDGVALRLRDGVIEDVDVGEALFDGVLVFDAVLLGVNDDVALFVGETDDERVGLTEGVPLRVLLPVTVPDDERVGLTVTVAVADEVDDVVVDADALDDEDVDDIAVVVAAPDADVDALGVELEFEVGVALALPDSDAKNVSIFVNEKYADRDEVADDVAVDVTDALRVTELVVVTDTDSVLYIEVDPTIVSDPTSERDDVAVALTDNIDVAEADDVAIADALLVTELVVVANSDSVP